MASRLSLSGKFDINDWMFQLGDQKKRKLKKDLEAKTSGVYLWEARRNQCRFIAERWDNVLLAICCGAKVTKGSWCDEHRKVVYRQSQPTNRG